MAKKISKKYTLKDNYNHKGKWHHKGDKISLTKKEYEYLCSINKV